MVEFDVQIKAGDLYDYMMRHVYNSPMGIVGNGIGGVMVVAAVLMRNWLALILGLIILFYIPWSLFLKSRQQALKNPAFKKPLHFVMDDEGISVSQGEECQKQAWEDLFKAVSTPNSIIVYTSPVNASIFPKRELGAQKAQVIEMISTHMPPKKVKIKD